MTRKYIDEQQVFPRYLGGQLSQRERAEFEEYWARNPSIIDELEATARLQDGIGQLHGTGRFAEVLRQRASHRFGWPVALAASLIVAVVGVFAWIGVRDANSPILAASPAQFLTNTAAPASQLVDVQRARGTLYDATIALPNAPTLLELHVLPDTRTPSARYTATLLSITSDGTRTALGTAIGIPLDEDGSVIVYVDSARLEPTRYELRLTADPQTNATDKPMSFLLKVNPPASN
jgi:hypothetical protein